MERLGGVEGVDESSGARAGVYATCTVYGLLLCWGRGQKGRERAKK